MTADPSEPTPAGTALEVADWRRRVWQLYVEVRETADRDPAAAHQHWQEVRNALFASHPASPVPTAERGSFVRLPVARYDPGWRLVLPVEAAEPARIEMTTGSDGQVPFERIGRFEIPDVGGLDLWRLASYGGGLFLPFRDGLAGRPCGTYGGGRYLLDTAKGADLGRAGQALVLDFNFAYNPSCAYDPAWACPLAPAGNVLSVEIGVGELSGS
jgi:uncharacterized protein (DUF1684 family)